MVYEAIACILGYFLIYLCVWLFVKVPRKDMKQVDKHIYLNNHVTLVHACLGIILRKFFNSAAGHYFYMNGIIWGLPSNYWVDLISTVKLGLTYLDISHLLYLWPYHWSCHRHYRYCHTTSSSCRHGIWVLILLEWIWRIGISE